MLRTDTLGILEPLNDFSDRSSASQRAAFANMQSSGKLYPKNKKGNRIPKRKSGKKIKDDQKRNSRTANMKIIPISDLKVGDIVVPVENYFTTAGYWINRVPIKVIRINKKSVTFDMYSDTHGKSRIKIPKKTKIGHSMFSRDSGEVKPEFYKLPDYEAKYTMIGDTRTIEVGKGDKDVKLKKSDLVLKGSSNRGWWWETKDGYIFNNFGNLIKGKPSEVHDTREEAETELDYKFDTEEYLNDCIEYEPVGDLIKSFPGTVINEAKKFLGCKEDPNRPNRSYCVDEIKKLGGWAVTNEPWCAQFVYAVTDMACKIFKIENRLPKTKSTRFMLNNAPKNGITVNKKPNKGCIFFIPRGDNPAFGHVGFVADIKGNTIYTIEGNYKNSVGLGEREIFNEMRFIHIHEMTDKKIWSTALKIGVPVTLSLGAWYAFKKFT